jgi:hypothetical protein
MRRLLSLLVFFVGLLGVIPQAHALQDTFKPVEKKVEWKEPNPLGPKNGVSTVPIVGTNKAGRLYDKRNGQFITKEQAAASKEITDGYKAAKQIDIPGAKFDTGEHSVGVNYGIIKDGEIKLADGKYGNVTVQVLQAKANASGNLGLTSNGLQGNLKGEATATLVGISGELKNVGLGDPKGLNNASLGATGSAAVLATAKGDLHLGVTKQGINAGGNFEAFAGAKAEAQAKGMVTILGIQVTATGNVEASAGIGASGSFSAKFDWSNMSFKVGGKLAATLGLGAGAGGSVEISIKPLVKYAGTKLASAAKTVGGWFSSGISAIGGWFSSPPPPTQQGIQTPRMTPDTKQAQAQALAKAQADQVTSSTTGSGNGIARGHSGH